MLLERRSVAAIAAALAVLAAVSIPAVDAKRRSSARFHSPDRIPGASWQPFSKRSVWNQRLPGNARLSPRSSQIVSRFLEPRTIPNSLRAGTAGTASDFNDPIYFGNRSDPPWKVRGGSVVPPYRLDGRTVRAPAGIRPAAGEDGGMALVYNGWHYGFGHARVDAANRIIYAGFGRRVRINGDGLHAAEASGRFPIIAGLIRLPELRAGRISHTLAVASAVTASTWVFPAENSDGTRDASQGYPPIGTRFRLDPGYATNAFLKRFPRWKRAILRAMREYGLIIVNSGSAGWKIGQESATMYTAFGRPDPWVAYARGLKLPSFSADGRTMYNFDVGPGVDWSKLRVVEPCVSRRKC